MTNQTLPPNVVTVSDRYSLILSDGDTLPPTVCPELVPAGYVLEDEVLDFQIGGDYIEAYLIRRVA